MAGGPRTLRHALAAVAAVACCLLTLAGAAASSAATPVLQMEQPTLLLSIGNSTDGSDSMASGQLAFGVQLLGAAGSKPVTASLRVQLPTDAVDSSSGDGGSAGSSNWTIADASDLWLEPATVRWEAGEAGSTKYVRLRWASELPLVAALEEALYAAGSPLDLADAAAWPASSSKQQQQQLEVLRVRLADASGASLVARQASTTLLLHDSDGREESSGTPLFGIVANQAAYPPSKASSSSTAEIPVRLLAGQLEEAATLRYSLRLLTTAVRQQFMPSRALHGFLHFQPQPAASVAAGKGGSSSGSKGGKKQQQQQQLIRVPLAWDRIPPEAEYRLAVQLEPVYNARVAAQSEAVALHIFGTSLGTCPPGTALDTAGGGSIVGGAGRPASSSSSSGSDGLDPFEDGAVFGLSFNGSVIDLSTSFQPDVLEYGAMVESDVSTVTLCLRASEQGGSGSVHIVAAGSSSSTGPAGSPPPPVKPASAAAATAACGCDSGVQGDDEGEGEDGDDGDSSQAAGGLVEERSLPPSSGSSSSSSSSSTGGRACEYDAWLLPLRAGQNVFNITLPPGEQEGAGQGQGGLQSAAGPVEATMVQTLAHSSNSSSPSSSSGSANGSNGGSGGSGMQYSLAVVRLADPESTELESITVKTSDDTTTMLCGPRAAAPGTTWQASGRAALDLASSSGNGSGGAMSQLRSIKPCRPDTLLSLNVSDSSRMVSLTPALRRPDVPGIRVEVNGQVLSRGGDVAADQVEDTTAMQQQRSNASFLPSAFIMGLQPGSRMDVEVVVVAEDGVTAARYPIQFLLVESAVQQQGQGQGQQLTVAEGKGGGSNSNSSSSGGGIGGSSSGGTVSANSIGGNRSAAPVRPNGWPLAPSAQAFCSICPAGWAAAQANSSSCTMCPPGTYSRAAQSPACLSCQPGTFAYSWGSSYCKNCITGTYAPGVKSSLCLMCPATTTTLEDGQSECAVPLPADAYQEPRYAVVVSFDVILTGVEPEDVVVRAGVNAGYEAIITNLIRADTASAFNISIGDVQVESVRRVARRTLRANVTAMLGVEVPEGATDEDITAALEVERLSADDPMDMLATDPDRFFGRTTKTLEVEVASTVQATSESRPPGTSVGLLWGMLVPGILAIVVGSALVVTGCSKSKACARWRGAAGRRLATSRLAPRSLQYSRYSSAA